MSYTLHGRQISLFQPPEPGEEVPAAPCIFCGVACKHINDGGTAWVVGAMMDRGPEHFLYHGSPCCEGHAQDTRDNPPHGSVWRCGCEPDYVENVGAHCHACGEPRAQCAAYPSAASCPRCDDDMLAREPGGVILLHCDSCQFSGRWNPDTKQPERSPP